MFALVIHFWVDTFKLHLVETEEMVFSISHDNLQSSCFRPFLPGGYLSMVLAGVLGLCWWIIHLVSKPKISEHSFKRDLKGLPKKNVLPKLTKYHITEGLKTAKYLIKGCE
jgi:hypothetical protein